MNDTLKIVFVRTWWRYSPTDDGWFTFLYHWFNLIEAAAWFVFPWLVVRRSRRRRSTEMAASAEARRLEWGYAMAFFVFGLTDVREAWVQSSWLIWLKALNLVALIALRRVVMSRYYPDATLY